MYGEANDRPEDLDIIIVGAGVSGIGAARHLQDRVPGAKFTILEQRDSIGGTWDIFRYPGIRSDSDLHTFGYGFKPWRNEESIADGPAILSYVRETAAEGGIEPQIRFGHSVRSAKWSSETARWTVEAVRGDSGETVTLTSRWLLSAAGYYRYDRSWRPTWEGEETFEGRIVEPQFWPEDLDYTGRRVVVIGSGATAVTVVPAMAGTAGHVTMLQRSPTYIYAVPARDALANLIKRLLPSGLAYRVVRRKNVFLQRLTWVLCRRYPKQMKRMFVGHVASRLPEGYDVERHFTPSYNPWDQRVCAVPDGDLFKAINRGTASVVTDRIARFVPEGIVTESGRLLEADIVVAATGLDLVAFGGIELSVDGRPVDLSEHLAYRALMLSDVPNFAYAIGYTNSSWTLKVDIVCEYVCRLMAHMRERGLDVCVPVNDDPELELRPLLDFQAGYVQRVIDQFPMQGSKSPWELSMNYLKDRRELRETPVEDGVLRFSRVAERQSAAG